MLAFAVIPGRVRAADSAVRASPQMLTLDARLLRASRAVHRRLMSAFGAKSQPAWATRRGHLNRKHTGLG